MAKYLHILFLNLEHLLMLIYCSGVCIVLPEQVKCILSCLRQFYNEQKKVLTNYYFKHALIISMRFKLYLYIPAFIALQSWLEQLSTTPLVLRDPPVAVEAVEDCDDGKDTTDPTVFDLKRYLLRRPWISMTQAQARPPRARLARPRIGLGGLFLSTARPASFSADSASLACHLSCLSILRRTLISSSRC